MRLKTILVVSMALMFLTTSLFTVAFSKSVLTKETKLTHEGESPQTTQATAEDSTLNQKEPNKAPDFNNAEIKENPAKSWSPNIFPFDSFAEDFNTYETDMWRDFAKVDEDSTELVIGVNNAQPDSYVKISDLIAENGGKLVNTVSIENEIIAVVADLPLDLVPSFTEDVQASNLARYIEPNMKYQTQLVPNDPDWYLQWGPQKIEADYAWNTTIGDSSVLVAVVDTGIDWDHPDLAANYVSLGYDWVNGDSDPMDDNGHGTHCAGIIAAELNNGIGIAGLAQVQIMAEKGLDQYGGGYEDDLADAIIDAVNQGADILSNSWGGYGESMLIYDAVKYAHDSGVLIVAAAGNEATRNKLYPAAYDEVIAVTATEEFDYPAPFTNFGEWVEVAAPGVDIYSTVWDDTYTYMSGTSMSTPHISGTAALIWSQFPNMTRDQVRAQLRYTADDLGDPGFDDYYGYGRINARRAVEQASPEHDLLIFDWERPAYVKLGELAAFNTTVLNFGISDETNVELQLLVNSSMVDSASIAFLPEGTSTTVGLSWTPTVDGTYNVTSYVVPVPNETITQNNVITEIVTVVAPPPDITWILLATDPDEGVGTSLKAIYGQLYSDIIFLKVEHHWPWITVNDIDTAIFIDADQDPSTGLPDGSYPGQNTGIGADYLIVVGWEATEMWKWDPIAGFWDLSNPISLAYLDAPDGSNVFVVGVFLADVETAGTLDSAVSDIPSNWDWMPDTGYFTWLLIRYEHDLTVFLETPQRLQPSETSLVNATVYNVGLNNETDVELQLLINGTIVDNSTIPELVNGTSHTIAYLWTPTVDAMYNVTAYALPVPDENVTANNIMSRMVQVRYVSVALISDGSELLAITDILDSMGILYDIYNDNYIYLYTQDLNLLLSYPTVVFYQYDRPITSNEHLALNSYLSAGGNLLVTGYDSLGHPDDPLLADIVRSSSYGDNVGEPDLYVRDSAHPIMNGPYGSFPAGYYISGLYSDNDAAEADTSRGAVTLAELADNYDKIIATDTAGGKVVYWNGIGPFDWTQNIDCEVMFKNTMVWLMTQYEHELVVTLDAPSFLLPSDSSVLNATVHNIGLNNEANVELQLLIDGTVVRSELIPELENGTSHTIDYLWVPSAEGVYNVTTYAPPVAGENITMNNRITRFVTVTSPLINPIEGQWANYTISYYDSTGQITSTAYWNFTYDHYVEPYLIYITVWFKDPSGFIGTDWMIVNIMNRMVESGIWAGLWYPGWIETDITLGSTINLMEGPATVNGSKIIPVGMYPIDCWEIPVDMAGYSYTFWYDKVSGLWISMEYVDPYSNQRSELLLIDTNIPIGTTYEHELAAALEAPYFLEPSDSSLLNATVYNLGLSNETNVELQLLINGTQVDNVTIPELPNGTSYTMSYLWTPMVEATYNVTAYALPVLEENITINNAVTQLVRVRTVKGYVLFDQTHFTDSIFFYNIWVTDLIDRGYIIDTLTTSPITQPVLEGYDVFVIPQAHDYYSLDELAAIQNFVLNGGGLLVIGDDAPYIYTDLTGFAGITWDFGAYWGYTNDITPHPVTEGVTTAYFDSPGLVRVASPAQDIIRDNYGNGLLAVSEVGLGAVIGIADEHSINDYSISFGDNQRLANNMIDWLKSRRPVASFTYSPMDPHVGEIVIFDASNSSDPDGTIVSYIWDFGDDISGDGNITTHVYAAGGIYTIALTVVDNENLNSTSTTAITVSRTTLDIEVEVGSIHFRGEIAEFYILVSSLGSPVDANINATLYYNETPYENLTDDVNRITTGFYRIPYTIPTDASSGTYALVVEAKYLSLKGAALKSFLLSPTLTGWNALLININGTVGTLKTDLGLIEVKLDTINVTLKSIEGRMGTIETDIGTIKADVGVINAVLISIDGRIATIESDLGTIKTDINSINANIIAINGTLVTINSTIGSVQQDISTINGRITAIDGMLANIQTDIGFIQTNISTINARLTALDGSLATIQTDIGTVIANITEIQLEVTAINGTIVTLQTTLGTLEGEITSIEGSIATIETDIGIVKADISTVKEAQQASATPLYIILIPVLIIAGGAILLAILMRRKS